MVRLPLQGDSLPAPLALMGLRSGHFHNSSGAATAFRNSGEMPSPAGKRTS